MFGYTKLLHAYSQCQKNYTRTSVRNRPLYSVLITDSNDILSNIALPTVEILLASSDLAGDVGYRTSL